MLSYDHGGDIYGGDAPLLDLSISVNPLGMPPAAMEAIRQHTEEDVRYPDPFCRKLRAALAERYAIGAESMLCGCGSADLLLRLCLCLRPRRTLVTAPTFSEYARSAALAGSVIVEHPLEEAEDFTVTESFLSAAKPGTDLVFLCNPNNPTGQLCDTALMEALLDHCSKVGAYLVVDECFLPFTGAPSMLSHLARSPRLLILRAFTKIYAMAGLRLGVLLCSDTDLLDRIAACGAPWSVSTVAQRAGLAALSDEKWIPRTRELIVREREHMAAELAALGLRVFPGAGNFLLIKAPAPLHDALRQRGIWVRRCSTFTGLDDRYFRVGIQLPEANRLLIDALREVLHG